MRKDLISLKISPAGESFYENGILIPEFCTGYQREIDHSFDAEISLTKQIRNIGRPIPHLRRINPMICNPHTRGSRWRMDNSSMHSIRLPKSASLSHLILENRKNNCTGRNLVPRGWNGCGPRCQEGYNSVYGHPSPRKRGVRRVGEEAGWYPWAAIPPAVCRRPFTGSGIEKKDLRGLDGFLPE
jgi:hypothetical protein